MRPLKWRRVCIGGALLIVTAAGAASAPDASASTPPQGCAIHWVPDPSGNDKFNVEVTGLATTALAGLRRADWTLSQWQRLLSVYAEQPELATNDLPPILGTYRLRGEALRFEPQFSAVSGVRYRAVVDPNQLPGARGTAEKLTAVWELPGHAPSATTVVSQVYPSANMLPENLLKFYLHFSAPMSGGHVYDYIHLRDENGRDVELPFLELDEELWNPAMTRLTLFIDPGRIKRGVRPLEEIGPALQDGKRYALVIDQAWKDGSGNPLKQSFRKFFKTGSPDREPLNPAQWTIRAPKSGTREPLAIIFPKPMDHALAQRLIHVTTRSGELVPGQTALQDEERQWRFVPNASWLRGAHQLLVETTIEDLAGNNIGKPFEVDLFDESPGRLTNATVKLPFQVE